MPALFSFWEAFNSTKLDDRLIELVGELSEEHIAGTAGPEGSVAWKDVGIWSSKQWTVLVGKALGSMSAPLPTSICFCTDRIRPQMFLLEVAG